MANWAIVIGIDRYDWNLNAHLNGAVQDALGMTKWLFDPRGGNVPPNNLFLLLSPTEHDVLPTNLGLNVYGASKTKIIEAAEQLLSPALSDGNGEKFFFYFAGHGLGATIGSDQALIPSDFTDLDPERSISLRSIEEYFSTTKFKDQFFFIDACRNIPWDDNFAMGHIKSRGKTNPEVNQFVIKSTSPGVKAAEMGIAGDANGIFTGALLDALTNGIGEAKVWDPDKETYVISVTRLHQFLEKEIFKRMNALKNMHPRAPRLIQIPRISGERNGSDPILTEFPANKFPKEKLEVVVKPDDVMATLEVSIFSEWGPEESQKNIAAMPISFSLQPKSYRIRASALNYKSIGTNLELYTYKSVPIVMSQTGVSPNG